MERQRGGGFTLVELTVVLALAAVLAAILFPAVQAAREAARRLQCSNNLKQLGLALHHYHDVHRTLPFGWDTHGTLWSATLLPFLEQRALHDTLYWQEAGPGNWNAAGSPNTAACSTVLDVYQCPSMPGPRQVASQSIPQRAKGSYRACAGSEASSDDTSTMVPGTRSLEMLHLNGLFYGCSSSEFADVRDGLSHTIAIGESQTDPLFVRDANAMDYWYIGSPQIDACTCDGGTSGTEFSEAVGSTYERMNLRRLDPAASGYLLEISYGSYHAQGAAFGLADGSVRYLRDSIDRRAYQALGSRNGNEVAGGE